MITKDEFDKLAQLIKQVVDDELDEKIPNYIQYLPTKEEFSSRMDKLMGEVKTMRESQELHANSHKDVNNEIDKLKTRVDTLEKPTAPNN